MLTVRYLAATAQLPAAFMVASCPAASATGVSALNSVVRKVRRRPMSPSLPSPVSVAIMSPFAASNLGPTSVPAQAAGATAVPQPVRPWTFLSTLPTPAPVSLLPAPPPRYAQKLPTGSTIGS